MLSPPRTRHPVSAALTPPRRRGDLARPVTTYTSNFAGPLDRRQRDTEVENPWIERAAVPDGFPVDETHWLTMETDPSVSGAMAARIAQLLGGGVKLEAGRGEGAQELLAFWEDQLAELPLVTWTTLGLTSFFRGWRPFEIIAANRIWEGKPVFVPTQVKSSLSWHFRHTVGGDLVHRPAGMFGAMSQPYRRKTINGQAKFFLPTMGDLGNAYGFPLHRNWQWMDVAYRELSAIGMTHMRTSSGVLMVDGVSDLTGAFTDHDEAKIKSVAARVMSFINEMQSGGAVVKPPGWIVDYLAQPQAIGGWKELFEFFRSAAMTYYAQGDQTMSSQGGGSEARSRVQDAVGRRVAKLDACQYQEAFRSFLRAWSSINAPSVAPKAFPATGPRPQLLDVPLRAVPHLVFTSLNRLMADDLAVLNTVHNIGVTMPEGLTAEEKKAAQIQVDVASALTTHNLRLVNQGEVGAILDFSKKPAPPTPFPARPDVLERDVDDEADDPEDQDLFEG